MMPTRFAEEDTPSTKGYLTLSCQNQQSATILLGFRPILCLRRLCASSERYNGVIYCSRVYHPSKVMGSYKYQAGGSQF